MNRNFYYFGREWSYNHIKPIIICEEYIVDEKSKELRDYKFMCFIGKVKCSFVCLNRNSLNGLNVDFYDLNWTRMPFERRYLSSNTFIKKPLNYNKIVKIAEKLSMNHSFLRVDFYEANERLYFGELTLYPGSGFEGFTPESYDYVLGIWLDLPKNKI